MAYTVRLKPRAEHDLDRLPLPVAGRVARAMITRGVSRQSGAFVQPKGRGSLTLSQPQQCMEMS